MASEMSADPRLLSAEFLTKLRGKAKEFTETGLLTLGVTITGVLDHIDALTERLEHQREQIAELLKQKEQQHQTETDNRITDSKRHE